MNNFSGHNFTDSQLIDRVLQGDTPAFGDIITRTEKLVTQIVFKMIDHAEDRKDIVQDTYTKAFRKLPEFRFRSKLSTWIAQICYNTCIDFYRKKKPVIIDMLPEENVQDDVETGLPGGVVNQLTTDTNALMVQKDVSRILKAAIEKLPPVYKTLITLYHNEEMTYEEIVQITGLPGGTVKNYLFRARKVLKNDLLLYYKKEDLW